jgi:hypothetical protein
MALANPYSSLEAYSGTQSAVYKLDVSEVLAQILLDDTDTLSTLGISADTVKQTKHQWVEDSLNATTIKQSGGNSYLSGYNDTVIVFSASHITRITAGTLLRDTLSGKTEVLQVTAISTASATVTRGYGASLSAQHAKSATWEIIANARPQGMAGPKDESTARAFAYNYTQIFSKGVKITGTAQSIEHYGLSSEDSYQITARLKELKREIDRTVLMGARAPNDVASTTYGTMGGLIEFIGLINTGNKTTTAETLTPTVLNAMCKQIYDDGGTPDIVIVGATQMQKISSFDQEFRRSTMDTRRAGYVVQEFITDLGVSLRVVLDRWMPADTAIVIDSSRVKIMPMAGRSVFVEKLAKTGDSDNWQIVGEYTMEVRNANEAHAIHINLKA